MSRARKPREGGAAAAVQSFLETLRVPEGPRAGERLKLAPYQRQFVAGALGEGVDVACLSIGRGNGKSALSAAIALAGLLAVFDRQPRRDVILAARTRDQARVAFAFAESFCNHLPDDVRAQLQFRRSPRLEIEFHGDGGGHLLRAIAADGKSALGSGPTFVLMDERGHWSADRGDALEQALLTGLGKRGGRALIISTSAPDDANSFSRWLDHPPPRTYVQEHRPAPGLPADDLESLLVANPGAAAGVGASIAWLEQAAARAVAQGGSALTAFRLYHRNERVTGESRDVLLTIDQWLACEAASLPPREGPVVLGLDLGGSASMSAAAHYWPQTGRLEVLAWLPSQPSLLDRGQADRVGSRYAEMRQRGELFTLGARTVPVAGFIAAAIRVIEGQPLAAIVADRFKESEFCEALAAAGVSAPVVWRGFGWRDGAEDIDRFRRACFDGRVKCGESLLMRSALAEAVCLRDPAGNLKLAKGRSNGRIDAAAAAVLAVAEGARQTARPVLKPRRLIWAA